MERKIEKYNFEVTTIKFGQPRPYADSEYEYEIVSDCSEVTVKAFCTSMLMQCRQTYEQWIRHNADSYFAGYYRFSKIADNKYRYFVLRPFCD